MIYSSGTRRISRILAIFLTFTAMISFLLPLTARSSDTKRKIRIPCGMNDLLLLDKNGEPTGHFCDYISKLADINGWEYEYIEANWTDAVKMLDEGKLDILFPTNYSPERDETMDFSDLNAGYTAAGLFCHSGSEYNYEDFGSWDGVRIAVSKGSSNEEELVAFARNNGFSYEPVYISDMNEKIAALRSGEADMIIFSAANDVPDAKLVSILDPSPFYLAVKEGNKSLLSEIDHGMKKLISEYPEMVSETNIRCLVGNNSAVQAFTDEERRFVSSGREITVGFYVDSEPLGYIDNAGEYRGVYPELMKYLNANSELNIRLVPLTRDKKWREYLSEGVIDFYIGASAPVAAQDPTLLTTDTFIDYMTILVTGSHCKFNTIQDPVIALTNGRAYWVDHLPKSLGDVDIKFYKSAKDCLSAVRRGEVDATLLNNYEYNYHSKNARFSTLITWENYRFGAEGGLTCLADTDPVMFSAVNKSLNCLTTDKVNEIVSSSLNMPYRSELVDTIYASRYALIISTAVAILVATVIGFVIAARRKQQKILEKEQENLRILAALSQDYDAVYFTDLDADSCRLIRISEAKARMLSHSEKHSQAMTDYVLTRVKPEYRKELLKLADPKEVIRRFETEEKDFAIRYLINPDEKGHEFYEMHFVDAGKEDNDHFMVFGIRCVDDIAKDEINRKQLLRDALETAEKASSAKTDFLSKMSHDMRTPLNAVIGMTAIAEEHLDDPKRIKDSLEKISASGKHLLALVNEVLDMSKIESGTLSLAEEDFDLSAMLDELMNMIHPQVTKHKHTLTTDYGHLEHTHVTGDRFRLQQIFMNILGNAVKYTPEGGELDLTVTEKLTSSSKAAVFIFRFTDNGIGMSEEFQKQIFDPFSRAEDPRISKIQGTGLGMSIAGNIIRMMNGSIDVKSEEGKGSVFTVTVPLKLADVPEESSAPIDSTVSVFRDNDFTGRRALVVEDNELNMEIACEILGMTGLELETAENGRIAVEMFNASPAGHYDIVFMDLQMPEMNGHEAAKSIRASGHPDGSTIPIIAMTANAFAEDRKASKEAGMNEHLAKPLDFAKLSGVLSKYLGG